MFRGSDHALSVTRQARQGENADPPEQRGLLRRHAPDQRPLVAACATQPQPEQVDKPAHAALLAVHAQLQRRDAVEPARTRARARVS
eukprot:288133-Pleurochrysis_carterae.AAC.1